MHKSFIALLTLWLYPLLLFAQPANPVSGLVKDQNCKAISGAKIVLLQANSSIINSGFSYKTGLERDLLFV